jgi:tyrosine-protein kinase Etk/Wzc
MTAVQKNVEKRAAENDEIDLGELIGTLIDHKWLIGLVTGLFFLGSVAYALLATPIYQANAVVQVEKKVPSLPGLSDIAQSLGATTSPAVTEIALLTSRTVIGQAVDDLKLNIQVAPDRLPVLGNAIARRFAASQPDAVASPWLGLSRYDWGGSALDVFQLDVPDSLLTKPLMLVAGDNGSYTLLDDSGDTLFKGAVGEVASGRGVTMQVKSLRANPGTRFEVTRNRTLATIVQLQQDIGAAEQGKDSGIIALTYQNADPAVAAAILDQVSELYVRQNVERNSAEAASSLQFVKEQLPNVRRELEKAQDALNAFQTRAHTVDISLQTKGLLDQIVTVESSIQQLRLQLAEADRRYTHEHPAYIALQQQIGQLQARKEAMEKQVGELPDTQQELLRLTRDVKVSNETYTSLLDQAQRLDIARAGTVGNVRLIDKAAVDVTQPVKPKKALVVLGGTLLGGFLAVAFVFLRQMLNRGVEDPAVIEQLGLPVYASIPLSEQERASSVQSDRRGARSRRGLLATSAPADLATEALRSLRTSLHFARLEARNNVLMISGASPGAGKTFVSCNLAAVVAQAGQRVLLIDADMRKGSLHKVMGGVAEHGLSELIAGRLELAEAIRQADGIDSLHYISRGKAPPNPSELLMNARFTTLLEGLMPRYDLIIIDTPPILAVTDAAIIGGRVGTSLLVARFGLNQPREIALAKQHFEQNGIELKGAILNAVEKRAAGYYGYAYYEYTSEPA